MIQSSTKQIKVQFLYMCQNLFVLLKYTNKCKRRYVNSAATIRQKMHKDTLVCMFPVPNDLNNGHASFDSKLLCV